MTIKFDNPDESFDEFALAENVDDISVPEPLRFAPWHKPRKQYVRKHQWIHHANSIISKLKEDGWLEESVPLKYLTLPGPDLLDVKLMADVCSDHDIDLHYTGFCYVQETEAVRLRRNSQQFGLDRGDQIREGSGVHISRLEEISTNNSEARTLMERGGPYSIINIDACEPIASDDKNQTGRLVDAIKTIVQYQMDVNRQPWMLYLTTPVQTDSVSAEALLALHDQVHRNVRSDADFAAELMQQFSDGEEVEQYLERVSKADGLEFVQTITLGISKWLVHLAEQANFKVKKLPAVCYSMFRREPFLPNMISTCYLFLPCPIQLFDQTGLTQNVTLEQGTPPISDHIRALRKSIGIENLDDKLVNDAELKQQMINETKSLLSAVGYDVDNDRSGYDSWLSNEPIEIGSNAVEIAS